MSLSGLLRGLRPTVIWRALLAFGPCRRYRNDFLSEVGNQNFGVVVFFLIRLQSK